MTTLVSDAFTASNGTIINGRTPDVTVSGRTWSIGNLNGTTEAGTIDIQNNKARVTATNDGFGIDCSAFEYTVIMYQTPVFVSGQFRGGCRFRVQNAIPFTAAGDRDFYFLAIRFDLTTATFRFVKQVNGTETQIGSTADYTFTSGNTYKITITVIGTTYSLYVDDIFQTSWIDSTYTGGTWIGFGAGNVSINNFTIDSIQVDSIVSTIFRRTESDRVGSRS